MSSEPRYSLKRVGAILTVSFFLATAIGWQAVAPLRVKIAARYLLRGDNFLKNRQFKEAEQSYQQSLVYNETPEGVARLHLAIRSETDIAQASDFYQKNGVTEVTAALQIALRDFKDPKQALQTGADFYQQGEYNYAQYPLQKAVQLDPGYTEAWHYLGLDYQELAKINKNYTDQAAAAFAKQNSLSPSYLPTR